MLGELRFAFRFWLSLAIVMTSHMPIGRRLRMVFRSVGTR